jgi:hypothetical protein
MNTKLLAALLFSSAVIATPAFAGNAHVGDDANALAATSTPSTLTRAQVRSDLVQSEQLAGRTGNEETTYPVLGQSSINVSRAAIKQGVNVASNSKNNIFAFGHDAS